MKYITNQYYEVTGTRGQYGLVDRFDTLEEAFEAGQEMNKQEKENGYKESEWIVVKTVIVRTFKDDGTFMSEDCSKVRRYL